MPRSCTRTSRLPSRRAGRGAVTHTHGSARGFHSAHRPAGRAAVRLWTTYAEWLAQELDAGSVQAVEGRVDETVPVATYNAVVNVYERALQVAGLHMAEV